MYAGGIWKGDILVADIEELENDGRTEIYSKRLNGKEVIFPKKMENLLFPAADGRITLSGRDQELRTSTSIRERAIQGEGQRDFLGRVSTSTTSRLTSRCRGRTKGLLVHVRKLHFPPSR